MSPARARTRPTTEPSEEPSEEPDGRVLRGRRNRAAIVEAIYELIQEGGAQPTARQVAARAGVQPRTVFRHFQDMASLNAELSARVRSEVAPLIHETPYEGALAERIATVARVRSEAFERFAPFERVSRGMLDRYEFLRADHADTVLELRENLRTALPEIRQLPQPLSAALELVFSFEAWDHLRADQDLRPLQARRAVEQAALALFAVAATDA